MRIATWNLKQAVAPKQPLDQLWNWAATTIRPDVIALTEAKVPKTGVPDGWTASWNPEGIGPRRTWGTVLAARGVELTPIDTVRVGRTTERLEFEWPAAVQVADIVERGIRWGTIVGLYALTMDANGNSTGNGGYSLPSALQCLEPLLASDKGDRVIIAGDFNLLPSDVTRRLQRYGLADLIEVTARTRPPLVNCIDCRALRGCGHVWTHKNGNSPNAAVQQIDYLFATEQLADRLVRLDGGVGHFPDAWDVSDHAPVVAEFR